ncbi:oxygenase MpaB family protein [Agromyces intestinalis]|uniref:oxygenase MpaB family protein n=1 Tax=Agromyces intestinalis TaxID=2592652 RepID=UPI00143CDF67|nr:oxygenase MpaB family protein [Agromyces intestinalis]
MPVRTDEARAGDPGDAPAGSALPSDADRAVFRRHAGDATLLVGGAAAILLQLADPRVARGVARHSGFRESPMRRLRATLEYAYAIGFGDDRAVAAVVREVNARHAPVRGRPDASEPGYSAFDADAQRWVASTLAAVALRVHERVSGPMPEPVADAIVRGYAPLAARLQAGGAGWPATRAEFDGWWEERVAGLEVGDDARRLARDLLVHARLPAPLRLTQAPVRILTAALLPPAIRDAYGFRWTRRIARVADGWFRAIAIARVLIPDPVRRIPLRISLRRVAARTG